MFFFWVRLDGKITKLFDVCKIYRTIVSTQHNKDIVVKLYLPQEVEELHHGKLFMYARSATLYNS